LHSCSLYIDFFGLWFFYPDITLHRADAGFRKAKETINPEQLRAWALEEISKNPTNDGIFPPKIPNSEIPSYMQKLYLEHVEDAVIWKFPSNTNFTLLTLHSNSLEQIGQTNVTIFLVVHFFIGCLKLVQRISCRQTIHMLQLFNGFLVFITVAKTRCIHLSELSFVN
jgi:hypothetical protein